MTTVGVLLSGCGVFDGAEIHESVLTLLALDRAGATSRCMAPDTPQMHVVDHRTGGETGERRNVLTESARIARGRIDDVADVRAEELDALVLPGGFGAAKNLSDFATRGAEASVQPDVKRLLTEMLDAQKPIGVACIAPAVLAAVLRDLGRGGELTIGDDAETAAQLEAMGITHRACPVGEVRIDEHLGVVSTPAYMLAGRISEAAEGLEAWVAEVLRMVRKRAGAAARSAIER